MCEKYREIEFNGSFENVVKNVCSMFARMLNFFEVFMGGCEKNEEIDYWIDFFLMYFYTERLFHIDDFKIL